MADGSRTFDGLEARDPTVLASVYRAHSAYVWRVLRHCGVPDSDLDDAVQETFLVVVRRLPEFEARASLRTWIYAIAVRVAASRRRSQRREAARRELVGEQMHAASTADPERALAQVEAADLVDRLLDELDDPKRTVFVLAEIEGVKVPEISRILGVNPRTVHSRLRLARESFGSALRRARAREEGNLRVARLRPHALLERAANHRPPLRRRKAVWAALAVRIEQGAGPTLAGWESVAPGGAATTSGGVLAVIGLTGAVVVGIAGGTALSGSEPSAKASPTVVRTAPSTVEPPVAPSAGSTSDPPAAAVPREPEAPPMAVHGRPELDGPPKPRAVERSLPRAGPARAPARRDGGASAEASPAEESSAETPSSDPASSLAAETRLLEQARRALRRGDAVAALAALDAHGSRFPKGVLLDEARSTRLRALCAAGRPGEAAELAERLAPAQPGSRWHRVVAAACR